MKRGLICLAGVLSFWSFSVSKASEVEMVKVRLFTTNQSLIKIYENFSVINTLEIQDIKEPIELKHQNMRINSHSVPSHIILFPRENKSIDVIAVLDMEDYLKGVLPHEMPLTWPLEALKAQAVVARSFTKKQMQVRKSNPYHLDSTVNDQVYFYNSTFSEKEKNNLQKALDETRNEILVDDGGDLAKTLYHADCGGQTEKASRVWGQKEVEFSVKDSNCPSTPYSNWEVQMTSEELKEKLKINFIPTKLTITSHTLSQRATQMEIVGLNLKEQNQNHEMSSQEFRRLIGYSKLKSTKFEIQKIGDDFLFKGSGFGHGVGLCQWGAKSWAQQGLSYRAILKHYFPTYSLKSVTRHD